MTDDERITVLELERKEQHRTNEHICSEIKDIKDNHLTHLALAVEEVRDELDIVEATAKSAKFRSGLTIYGLAFIGIMLTILGVMVAVR
ncbi:hypothetical protein LCGC14_0861560 [marine sediment metagenome]|uniref:Uncharacterized protein n=1 Tax=marine sediment metagenome TaxID=412755 RepID=A0A0F9PSQ3_9ZZZZ